MIKRAYGFTIVELLVVIVVVAILASVTAVAFNGVQAKSRNTALNSALIATEKALRLYAAQSGAYPQPTDINNTGAATSACIGKPADYPANINYPAGICDVADATYVLVPL